MYYFNPLDVNLGYVDCRYKLYQIAANWCKLEGAKEKKRGAESQSSRLDWNPAN